MKHSLKYVFTSTVIGALLCTSAVAETQRVDDLSKQWQQAAFVVAPEFRSRELHQLSQVAKSALLEDPNNPELLAWSGIISASYAGARGGLHALKAARNARDTLEQALALDPDALNGGAATSLGTLYHRVPGWPLGFGDPKKAEKLLSDSAHKFTDNLAVQYFYGDFLMSRNRYAEARAVYSSARLIPVREEARIVDEARLADIEESLARIDTIMQ